jgi:hypothetical protein
MLSGALALVPPFLVFFGYLSNVGIGLFEVATGQGFSQMCPSLVNQGVSTGLSSVVLLDNDRVLFRLEDPAAATQLYICTLSTGLLQR